MQIDNDEAQDEGPVFDDDEDIGDEWLKDPELACLNEDTVRVMRQKRWLQPGQEVPEEFRKLPDTIEAIAPPEVRDTVIWVLYNPRADSCLDPGSTAPSSR